MLLTLPWPSRLLSPNARSHWAAKSKAAKAYRMTCFTLALEAGLRGVPWEGPIHLHLTFYKPSRRRMDMDNALASAKNGLDGLADALGVNDSRFRLHLEFAEEIGGMIKIAISQESSGSVSAPTGEKS